MVKIKFSLSKKMLLKEIKKEGKEILESKRFKKCLNTSHHFNTTIGQHMINVTVKSLEIANFLQKHRFKIDRKRLIIAGLSHDLAMAFARENYGKIQGKFTTAFRHPIDSVKMAEEVIDVHKKTKKIIKRHMWPLCIIPPTSLEGWILTIADKIVATQEIFHKEKTYKII